ncbi:MAG: aminomethyl-transferring glycine dehydrogenase [Prevotellaceae bacterium]|jgi:glycine dehydrogenase|nr:aminomethyl-transferring glycine dehydrogenase [Prevotellaceae bacterium]
MFDAFVNRHNGVREADIDYMLRAIGASSLDELIDQTIPKNIRLTSPLALDAPVSEYEYLNRIRRIASKNKLVRSFIGMGWYGTAALPVVLRNVFENPSWYTSYTPYQSEISQGRLEALLNFQTMTSSLTGFPVSNCSLLDEATAAAEAMRMMFELRSREAVKAGRNILFADENMFPQNLDVLHTRAAPLGIEIVTGKYGDYVFDEKCFGAIVQYPAANGDVRDYSAFCGEAHSRQILVTAVCDILSLALLKEPAAWGADVAVGSTQRFGIPMGFGGPAAAYFATKDAYKRSMPGRIIGMSIDRLGKPALRMALQTREQHIKREKATSNICTATALSAIMAGMYAVYHGAEGLQRIAAHSRKYAVIIAGRLKAAGYALATAQFFDTIEVQNVDANTLREKALAAGMNFFYPTERSVRISFDEITTCDEAAAIMNVFGLPQCTDDDCRPAAALPPLPQPLQRTTPALTEKVFQHYRSETEMMRYIKKLERRDISLTQSMISLGSCTMKLNAAVEMLPLSFPEFCHIHPYAPSDQAAGYLQLIEELERDLATITGFDAVSLQPNSGAAGEYTGLMIIRAYHNANGAAHRNTALIPTSAHGTNPASAVMAGMNVVTVGCDAHGNINIDELREKAALHKDNLACMMITYPSTHGVFESRVKEITDIIHAHGGLVFMDGANMNAQVGFTNPGFIGADVCHLNLHKTFAMPHGGGGPGVGPVAVAKHLTPFLPSHRVVHTGGEKGISAVSAAPYGSAMLLPVSHAYIKLLGAEGLSRATAVAILNANYMSARLNPHYRTLFTGENGRVAHECIIDLQHFKKEYGVDAADVAKRLMDFGFHAPTLSFPVHETLMIEPTESEPKAELDRLVEALLAIKAECEAIKNGNADAADNPLKMSPHTAEEVTADAWTHPYPRTQAAYPLPWVADNKFWAHVARVDNGYGDRNLCSCSK